MRSQVKGMDAISAVRTIPDNKASKQNQTHTTEILSYKYKGDFHAMDHSGQNSCQRGTQAWNANGRVPYIPT